MKALLALALLILVVAAYGCGDSGESTGTASESSTQSTQEASTEKPDEEAPKEKPVKAAPKSAWASMEKAAGKDADRLLIPTGLSSEKVVVRDLRVGNGPVLQPNDVFKARYFTFDYQTGSLLEKSPKVPEVNYLYEKNAIVKAWTPGLKGMRLNGFREVIAPSYLAYATGPVIYLIEMVELEQR